MDRLDWRCAIALPDALPQPLEEALAANHGGSENLVAAVIVAHHVIVFTREASRGRAQASYYSTRLQEASIPAE